MKKIQRILLIIVLVLCAMFFYYLMLHDTDSVIQDFRDCVSCKEVPENVKETVLYEFYCRNDSFDYEIADANIKISRIFVLHNFKKGKMYINYTIETLNKDGIHIYGSHNIYSTWDIEKKNGKWIVTSIKEKP